MKEATIKIGDFIAKGLALNNNKRNNLMLTTAIGSMIYEGSLCAVQDLTSFQIDMSAYAPIYWPYPQLFTLSDCLVVALEDKIFEVDGTTPILKISGLTPGFAWTLLDFHSYLYMSNGMQAVTRDPQSFVYSLSTTLPVCMAAVDFNGQVLLGGTPII